MSDPTNPTIKASARVIFIANLALVRKELAEGWTAKALFERHADKFAGRISYPQFARYVRRLREDAAPASISGTAPSSRSRVLPTPPAAPASGSPAVGTPSHARHEPARPRTFEYDGNPRQDDEDRLIGPSKPRAKE